MLKEVKQFLLAQFFRFDPGSFVKLLSTKIEKNVSLSVAQLYPGRSCHHLD